MLACKVEKNIIHYVSASGFFFIGVCLTLTMVYGFGLNAQIDDRIWVCSMFGFFTVSILVLTFMAVRHYRLRRAADAGFIMEDI